MQKGPQATLQLHRSWAKGDWWEDIGCTVAVTRKLEDLAKAGLAVEFGVLPDEAEAQGPARIHPSLQVQG